MVHRERRSNFNFELVLTNFPSTRTTKVNVMNKQNTVVLYQLSQIDFVHHVYHCVK